MRSHKFAQHDGNMNSDEKRQHQRPEGLLLERAMKGPLKVSGRKLAEMALLSEGRVRQIVNGYKTEAGMTLPIVAPADTLARLGAALELGPEDFERVDRPDVAEILRGEISSGVTEEGDLWLLDENEHRIALADWLETGDETVPPPRSALMLWEMSALLDAVAKKHEDETRFLNNLITILRSEKGGDTHAAATHTREPDPSPTTRDEYGLAAHDEEHPIEDEQIVEFP